MEEIVYGRLMSDCFGRQSVAVYGGAYHLLKSGNDSFEAIAHGMTSAIRHAKFLTPEVRPSEVAKNFCSLLLIDPMLMEVYLGIRFTELNYA